MNNLRLVVLVGAVVAITRETLELSPLTPDEKKYLLVCQTRLRGRERAPKNDPMIQGSPASTEMLTMLEAQILGTEAINFGRQELLQSFSCSLSTPKIRG